MEANTMINLGEHPNLVNLVDANKSYCCYRKQDTENSQNGEKNYVTVKDEINYLILEKWENGSLSKYVKATGPFDELVGRFLFSQLCSSVFYMHSQEYVHLDIKLDNILLDKFFNLKLADLGIALCSKGTSKLLAHKRGTNRYMAPEVANASAKRPYNVFPADIYSLGVCLHLMLFGTYPSNDEDTEMSTGEEDSEGSPQEKSTFSAFSKANSSGLASWMSPECMDLLERMLDQDPDQRPSIEEIGCHSWMAQGFPENIGETVYSEMSERLNHLKMLVEDTTPSFSIDLE